MILRALTLAENLLSIYRKKEAVAQRLEIWKRKINRQRSWEGVASKCRGKLCPQSRPLCLDCSQPSCGHSGVPVRARSCLYGLLGLGPICWPGWDFPGLCWGLRLFLHCPLPLSPFTGVRTSVWSEVLPSSSCTDSLHPFTDVCP